MNKHCSDCGADLKEDCCCDEINARHCQFHQYIADLETENHRLHKAVEVMRKALEHIGASNYAVSEIGLGYTVRQVCVELFTDKELDVWARQALSEAEKILGEK